MPRKRKIGPRHPGGKLVQRSSGDRRGYVRRDDPRQEQAAARARVYGVMPTQALSDLAGSAPGRLYLRGELDSEQLEAARTLEALWQRYRAALAGPAPEASICGKEGPMGLDHRDTTERDERALAAWVDAQDAMGGRHGLAAAAVFRLVVEDRDPQGYDVDNAKIGLNGLVRLWRRPTGANR